MFKTGLDMQSKYKETSLGGLPSALWSVDPLLVVAPGTVSLALGFVLAFVLGAAVSCAVPALIVLGQEYLPNRIGTASGVKLGIAVSVGGMFSPVLGLIGDRWGLHATLLAIVGLLAISCVLGFLMPAPATSRREAMAA